MKYGLSLILFILSKLCCTSLLAQSSEFQAGVGYHSINYFGTDYSNDSLTFGGSPLSYPDPFFTFRYQRSLTKRLHAQIGLTLMRSFYGYRTGYYFPDLEMYILRTGHANLWKVMIPLDLKWYITQKVFVKAGLPLTLNFVRNSSSDLQYDEWEDKQHLYSIYNQLHHSYQKFIFNYGLGAGVDIWKLCVEVYLQSSLSAVSQPVLFAGDDYRVYNRTTSAFLSVAYRFNIREN